MSRQSRHAGWRFPFEGLPIQTSLACNHNIGIFDFRFEADCLCYNVKPRSNFRAAKTHQAEAQSACCAGTGFIAIIKTKFFGDNISQSGQCPFQFVDLVLCHAFLRTKHSRRAILAEQWIFHIHRSNNLRQDQVFRLLDSLETSQLGNRAS